MGIHDGINIFQNQKKRMKEKIEAIAKNTSSVIEIFCKKTLIGKNFLERSSTTLYMYEEAGSKPYPGQVNELQIIENGVYRKMLGAAHGTVLETIRGDIGASLMESKIMENKILFVKNIRKGKKLTNKKKF